MCIIYLRLVQNNLHAAPREFIVHPFKILIVKAQQLFITELQKC